jgi:hypothetical protein
MPFEKRTFVASWSRSCRVSVSALRSLASSAALSSDIGFASGRVGPRIRAGSSRSLRSSHTKSSSSSVMKILVALPTVVVESLSTVEVLGGGDED